MFPFPDDILDDDDSGDVLTVEKEPIDREDYETWGELPLSEWFASEGYLEFQAEVRERLAAYHAELLATAEGV